MANIDWRPATNANWPAILAAAATALLWGAAGNREWLENRKQF